MATSHGPIGSPEWWLQTGVLGLVLAGVLWRRWLVPGWALDQAERESERLRAELAALRQEVDMRMERTLATLTEAVEELTRAQRRPPGRRPSG